MLHPVRRKALLIALCLAALPLAAYEPPGAGGFIPLLGAPVSSGSGSSVTFLDAPWADRLNPAASAAQQRPVLDFGYGLLSDFGAQGIGTAINLGASLPEPYGVWGGGLTFVSTPASMTELALGTQVQLRGGIAKDLWPNFHLGASLAATLGSREGFGWGLGLDLGLMHKLGDLGPFKDLRYGAVLSGLGKAYSTPAGPAGPPAFSLSTGARALLLRSETLKIGLGLDLSLPSFQDLGFGLSASLIYRDLITLRTGWGIPSARELAAGGGKSLLPSLGLTASFSVDRPEGGEALELRPALSASPLYGRLWNLSAGLTLPLGIVDTKGPAIDLSFPATSWGPFYLSPNADGKLDLLEMPVKIGDRRYVASWLMSVVPAGGTEPTRAIANKESRPETQGLAEFWRRLVYVKTGVPVPESLSWNGFGEGGEKVPDGAYEVWVEARDDNGNATRVGPFPVMVDATPPAAEILPTDPSLIFSPDGDGNKDRLPLALSGSVEDLWTLKVLDPAGTAVRTVEWKEAAPADWSWDGKNDGESVVPDGVYSLLIAASDRAGNSFSRRLDNIVVNTQQAPINLAIGASAFSPDGDGTRDRITLTPSVPVRTGLASWRLSVVDRDRREVYGTGSTEASLIPERLAFDGKSDAGQALPEGSYQARLAVSYQNGHSPVVLSPPFILDVTAPKATVTASRVAFNPAGTEAQNRVAWTQAGSEEEGWTGEILGADGRARRSWTWNGRPEPRLEWDGTDDAGAPVPDGDYAYRLRAVDRAGNAFSSAPLPVAVDTERKIIRLGADLRAFSPNGDAVKDILTLSGAVQANERVRGWRLGLYPAPEAGARPDAATPLRSWTGSAAVPPSFTWDGGLDAGGKAPDGRYVALLAVDYANGDRAEAQTLPLVLDTVRPSIEVSASPLLFSPNEESSLRTTTISQKALPGDEWEGRILDAAGNTVRSWTWSGAVPDIVWDATDEAGNLVRDGSYRYEVSSTDAAGNGATAAIPAIGVDARRPQVSVTASALGLSPNGDGIQDSIAFTLDVTVKDGISAWSFVLLDAAGAERASFSGSGADLRPRIVWDGRNAAGKVVEGSYQGRLSLNYLNGNRPVANSPSFVLDLAAPAATVKADRQAFNPAGAPGQNRLTFAQTGSEEERWTGEILGADGKARRSWTWKSRPEAALAWDGTDDAGAPLPDGDYSYRLRATDRGGNSFSSTPLPLAIDTERKALRLGADLRAFSPNGDGVKDLVTLTGGVQSNSRPRAWKLGVYTAPETGQQPDRAKALKTWSGNGPIPASFSWNGTLDGGAKAADGRYVALIEASWPNGDAAEAQTLPIALDTVAPSITLSVSAPLFSPNGDGRLDTTTIVQKAAPGDDWEGRLLDAAGAPVRTWSWKGTVADIAWDATDGAGNRVKDGRYRYELGSTDAAGNATRAAIPAIEVDARVPQVFVTASGAGFSPNGDGVMDEMSFSLIINLKEGIAGWRFALVDAAGAEAASFSGSGEELLQRLVWDGKSSTGSVREGSYTGILSVDYRKGDRAEARTGALALDVTGPSVELALAPDFFSPDNDGVDDELRMAIAVRDASELASWRLEIDEASVEETPGAAPRERLFALWSGGGAPSPLITWDGRSTKGELVEAATEYPLYFDASDIYGNKSRLKGKVAVDVLVVREGDRLKIKVPSIVFRANFADFDGLDPAAVENNRKVIARIAEILGKFKDYRVVIEGHANSIGKIYGYSAARIAEEEQKELIPLSTNRAELVRKALVAAGLDARRLSVAGMGSSRPVVDFKDAVNRWKNRRVEFILIKAAERPAGSGG